MTPERQEQLERLQAALEPFTADAYKDGYRYGTTRGRLMAIQDGNWNE